MPLLFGQCRRGAASELKTISYAYLNLNMYAHVNRKAALQRKGMDIVTFCRVASGKCSEGLFDSCRALLKGYRKATGKCLKAIR
jgi:hypothetical protein